MAKNIHIEELILKIDILLNDKNISFSSEELVKLKDAKSLLLELRIHDTKSIKDNVDLLRIALNMFDLLLRFFSNYD